MSKARAPFRFKKNLKSCVLQLILVHETFIIQLQAPAPFFFLIAISLPQTTHFIAWRAKDCVYFCCYEMQCFFGRELRMDILDLMDEQTFFDVAT